MIIIVVIIIIFVYLLLLLLLLSYLIIIISITVEVHNAHVLLYDIHHHDHKWPISDDQQFQQFPGYSPHYNNLIHVSMCLHDQTSCIQLYTVTVKSFYFVGTKFRGLTTLDMIVDTWIRGFQIICNSFEVNKYFVGILNSWIAFPWNTQN